MLLPSKVSLLLTAKARPWGPILLIRLLYPELSLLLLPTETRARRAILLSSLLLSSKVTSRLLSTKGSSLLLSSAVGSRRAIVFAWRLSSKVSSLRLSVIVVVTKLLASLIAVIILLPSLSEAKVLVILIVVRFVPIQILIVVPKVCVLSLLLDASYSLAKPRPVSGGQALTLASASLTLTRGSGLLTSSILTLLLLVIIPHSGAPVIVSLVIIVSRRQISGGCRAAVKCKLNIFNYVFAICLL